MDGGPDRCRTSCGPGQREQAFGQSDDLSPVDRFGIWLSSRSLSRGVGDLSGRRFGDFGCGYHARTTRMFLPKVASAVLVDVDIVDNLVNDPKITALRGHLPETMAGIETSSLDVAVCMSVLEHLDDPQRMLSELYRVLAPGGICVVNVPTWAGKRLLEFSAFRLGLSPPAEMDDHKIYYDPKDLWPMLVKAGFMPHDIRCRRHKFGLNTLAVCHKAQNGQFRNGVPPVR